MTAELAEEPLVAVPGDHRDHHGGRGVRSRAQPFVAGLGLLVHVVDLDLADRAVPESFAEDGARVVGVNVDLHEAIVADDEGTVADRRQERLKRVAVDGLALDQQARAVAVTRKLGRLGDDDGAGGGGMERERAGAQAGAVHAELGDAGPDATVEHQQTVSSGVDDARLLQGGELAGRVLDRDPAGFFDDDHHVVERDAVGHALRSGRHLADDREHGALHGLLDGPVGGAGAFAERELELARPERVRAAPHLADAAYDLRQDDAGVAAGAHERALGHGGRYRGDAVLLGEPQLFDDGPHRQGEVGPGVAVGDRIHVEVVDDRPLRLHGGEGGFDDREGGGADAQSCRSSTRTVMSATGMPATFSTR